MNFLLPIASILGIETDAIIDRLKKNALAWSAIGGFGLVGLVFLLVAVYIALADWLGPIGAALVMGGASLLVAIVTFVAISITNDIVQRREAQRRRSAETTALVTTAAMTALPLALKSPLIRKVGIPVGGALAALFLLSRSGSNHRSEADD